MTRLQGRQEATGNKGFTREMGATGCTGGTGFVRETGETDFTGASGSICRPAAFRRLPALGGPLKKPSTSIPAGVFLIDL
jgi:hypothetical protein